MSGDAVLRWCRQQQQQQQEMAEVNSSTLQATAAAGEREQQTKGHTMNPSVITTTATTTTSDCSTLSEQCGVEVVAPTPTPTPAATSAHMASGGGGAAMTMATTITTTTKIPHPLVQANNIATVNAKMQLQQQQQQSQQQQNPFQRSCSLRMRDSKSNLLPSNNAGSTANISGGGGGGSIGGGKGCPLAQQHEVAHEFLATGRISPRRKLVLYSPKSSRQSSYNQTSQSQQQQQHNQQQQQHSQYNQLTRTLSLRRSNHRILNYLNKTESTTTIAAGAAAAAAANDCGGSQTTVGDDGGPITGAGAAVAAFKERQMQMPNGGPASHANVGSAYTGRRATNELMAQIDAELANSNEKMPLKPNATNSTNTTTTAIATATGAHAPNRPATLETLEQTAATKSKIHTPTSNTQQATILSPATATGGGHAHCTVVNGVGGRYTRYTPPTTATTTATAALTPKTPPVTPDSPAFVDDDIDSMYSFATTTSGRSTMSCEHPYVARNGTTFSGRKMKYVVHCSNYAGAVGPDYLTPTQRAARQIRRLKELLYAARQELEQKDHDLLNLTREVVELRLFKASLSSPEERSASSDAVTVREAELKTSQDVSPIVDMVELVDGLKGSPRHQQLLQQAQAQAQQRLSQPNVMQLSSSEMQNSFADSGHFEDLTSSSVHSKDDSSVHTHDIACGSDEVAECAAEALATAAAANEANYEAQRQELICMYEQRIDELIRSHDAASGELRHSHNDKVEALLQKLAECNTRYGDIVTNYEQAKERIRELETQLEHLQLKLAEHEDNQKRMYLHMYQQGQEAERIAQADQVLELAHRAPNSKVSFNELLQQLQKTQDELENIRAAECRMNEGNHALLTAKEAISLWVLGARKTIYRRLLDAQKNRTHVDPEVKLQFLKSAIYYFLTDKENSQGHLQAINSILEFTEAEKSNINKSRATK